MFDNTRWIFGNERLTFDNARLIIDDERSSPEGGGLDGKVTDK